MSKQIINTEIREYVKFRGAISSPAFLDMVELYPHDGQKAVLAAYEQKQPATEETKQWAASMGLKIEEEYTYNTIIAICGRRWGKSVISGGIGAAELMTPNAHVLICSYTLENTRIIFKQIRKIIKKLGIELVVDQNKDLHLELVNGSRLTCASVENVEAKLGSAVSLLILDEAKLFSRPLYEQILLPMTTDFNIFGRTIIISSPANNWIEDYYNMGQSKDPAYSKFYSINSPTSANPTISREFLRQKKLTTPPDIYECEYEGKFTSAAGLVCKSFSKDENVKKFEDYQFIWDWINGGEVIFNSIDPGYSHYFGAVWVLHAREIDTYLVLGSYHANNKFTSDHADYINEYEGDTLGREADLRYIDPASAQYRMDLSAFDIHCNNAEKPLRETIDTLNTLFFQQSKVTGEPRLIILEDGVGNEELIRQVSQIQWKVGSDGTTYEKTKGTKPFKADSHYLKTDFDIFDAFRYGIYSYEKTNGNQVSMIDLDISKDSDLSADEESMYNAGWVKM